MSDAQFEMQHNRVWITFLRQNVIPQLREAGIIGDGARFANDAAFITWFRAQPQNQFIFRGAAGTGVYEDCDGVRQRWSGHLIRKDQNIVLPELPNGEQYTDALCVDRTPAPVPAAPAAVSPEEPAVVRPTRPLAQFIPLSRGAWRNAVGSDGTNFFMGIPPRDAAADRDGRRDRVRGDRYAPGESEGTIVQNPDGREVRLDRTTFGERDYKPSQTIIIDRNGQPVRANREYDQKIEQNSRFVIDSRGNITSVVDGNAVISENRRLNPYYEGIWRDFRTAQNVITQWNNTAEGQMAITTWAGIEHQYQVIGDRYFAGNDASPERVQDAERLLQLNVQAALHPLVWSVSPQGVPVGDTSVLRAQAQRVLDSMPDGPEKERLRATYSPYLQQLDNPVALNAAIEANGGRANWYNPMMDWARERSQVDFVREGYDDTIDGRRRPRDDDFPDTLRGRRAYREAREAWDAEKAARPLEVGESYGRRFWEDSIRPPTESEQRLGRGESLSVERQSEPALRERRVEFLRRMETDPEFRRQVIENVVNTPGALQYWTDPMFYATRPERDSEQILGFPQGRERDARRMTESTSAKLGGEDHEDDVAFNRGDPFSNYILRPIGRMFTLGYAQPFNNRNSNNALDGLETATRERWAAGGATAAEVDEAFRQMAERYRIAEEQGMPIGGTSAVLSVAPNLIEDANRGQTTPAYRRLLELAGPRLAQLFEDQQTANIDRIGNVGAGMEAQLEADVMAGRRDPSGTGRFDTTDAADARTPAEQAAVLAAANNPAMVDQTQVNRNTVTNTAASSPAGFSLLTVLTMADPNTSAQARHSTRAYINSLIEHGGESEVYGEKLSHHIEAIQAAGSDPAARNAAIEAALEDFGQFFSSGNQTTAHRLAAQGLGGFIAQSNDASAAFAAQYNAFAVQDTNGFLARLAESGRITNDDRMALLALQGVTDPAVRATRFNEWLAEYQELQATLNADPGISAVETVKLGLFIALATIPGGSTVTGGVMDRTIIPTCC